MPRGTRRLFGACEILRVGEPCDSLSLPLGACTPIHGGQRAAASLPIASGPSLPRHCSIPGELARCRCAAGGPMPAGLCIACKIPIISALYGLGCRGDAAEIKPIEPVWVIPAKGAARLPNRPSPNPAKPNVAVIGAGVIGLGIAWRLAARGASVSVFDKGAAGAGASHAAAGMLAACAEAEPGEETLVALGRESQARWPAFAAELQQASGIDAELRQEGTLVVALT